MHKKKNTAHGFTWIDSSMFESKFAKVEKHAILSFSSHTYYYVHIQAQTYMDLDPLHKLKHLKKHYILDLIIANF